MFSFSPCDISLLPPKLPWLWTCFWLQAVLLLGFASTYSELNNCTLPGWKYCSPLLGSLLLEMRIRRLTASWVRGQRGVSLGSALPLLKSIANNETRNKILLAWWGAGEAASVYGPAVVRHARCAAWDDAGLAHHHHQFSTVWDFRSSRPHSAPVAGPQDTADIS